MATRLHFIWLSRMAMPSWYRQCLQHRPRSSRVVNLTLTQPLLKVSYTPAPTFHYAVSGSHWLCFDTILIPFLANGDTIHNPARSMTKGTKITLRRKMAASTSKAMSDVANAQDGQGQGASPRRGPGRPRRSDKAFSYREDSDDEMSDAAHVDLTTAHPSMPSMRSPQAPSDSVRGSAESTSIPEATAGDATSTVSSPVKKTVASSEIPKALTTPRSSQKNNRKDGPSPARGASLLGTPTTNITGPRVPKAEPIFITSRSFAPLPEVEVSQSDATSQPAKEGGMKRMDRKMTTATKVRSRWKRKHRPQRRTQEQTSTEGWKLVSSSHLSTICFLLSSVL